MLRARVITALFLVAGLLGVLFLLPPLATAIAFALVAALAGWEWGGLMKLAPAARVAYGAAMGALCAVAGWSGGDTWLWLASALFWLGAAPLWLRHRWPLARHAGIGLAVGVLVILPTWAAMVELQARGPWWLLGAMALVWVADIAAYFAGRAFGRRKLAPAISPGKTWEGVAGAMLGVLLYAFVVAGVAGRPLDLSATLLAVPALLLLTAVSIVGDLFESLLKRQAAVKDSSQLLPGHGGVLDRIDSLTAALPLVALALRGAPA